MAYYLIWLAAGLLAIATASAMLVWRAHVRELRQLRAVELLDALARSTEWLNAQGRALRFQAPTQDGDPALQETGAVQQRWFPELGDAMQSLFEVHLRLARVLRASERERLEDPEAWLEAGHDVAFIALAREHQRIVQDLEQRLAAIAPTSARVPEYTFPS